MNLDAKERMQCLCLGMALANQSLLLRVKETLREPDFAFGPCRNLFLALFEGKEEIAAVLAGLGCNVAEGQRVPDAVVENVQQAGQRARCKSLAYKVDMASKLVTPEQFEQVVRDLLAELQRNNTPQLKAAAS
jgi:hypothetical protein